MLRLTVYCMKAYLRQPVVTKEDQVCAKEDFIIGDASVLKYLYKASVKDFFIHVLSRIAIHENVKKNGAKCLLLKLIPRQL